MFVGGVVMKEAQGLELGAYRSLVALIGVGGGGLQATVRRT